MTRFKCVLREHLWALFPLALWIAFSAPANAGIVQPAAGSVVGSSSIIVRWDAEPDAIGYSLGVGTSAAAVSAAPWGDIAKLSLGTNTSTQVFDIPLNGARVYLRLMVQTANGYRMHDASFAAQIGTQDRKAILQSPLPREILKSNTAMRWDAGHGVSEYMLAVASNPERLPQSPWGDLYVYRGTATSTTLPRLPDDGKPLYVRLWSRILESWFYSDHVFASDRAAAAGLISPEAGTRLGKSTATFNWTNGSGATEYMLGIATRPEILAAAPWSDLFFYRGSANSVTTGRVLPLDGRNVYVRLWSKVNGNWLSADYPFSSSAVSPATLTGPSDTQPLAKQAQRFSWTAASGPVAEYALTLASSPFVAGGKAKGDIFNYSGPETSVVVPGLPLNGRDIHVRISSKINGEWFFKDSVYRTIVSVSPPDYAQECGERGWRRSTPEVEGLSRKVYWRTPVGNWSKGAIVLLHGGGSSYESWCSSGPGSHHMVAFTEAAIRQGFALVAIDSTEGVVLDAWGRQCGKRFDFASASSNVDLPFVDRLITNLIPAVRPSGSNSRVFVAGLSSGGFMTIRAGSHFDDKIAAFAAVGAGDPYGTHMVCEPTISDRTRAPGTFIDNDTQRTIGVPDACVATNHPNERAWESSGRMNKPPFKLLHHLYDNTVNISCMRKAAEQLVLRGYLDQGTVALDKPKQPPEETHLWQAEFNQPILDFFSKVATNSK